MERNEKIQVIYLFLISIFIVIIIFTLVFLIKNKELIQKDPINYAIDKRGFSYCTCLINNQMVYFGGTNTNITQANQILEPYKEKETYNFPNISIKLETTNLT